MTSIAFRYIVGHLTKVIASITLVILTIFTTLDLLDNFDSNNYVSVFDSLRATLLKLPEIAYLTLPATCAIGAVIALALLDSRGEIAMLRIAGVSRIRLLRWVGASATIWVLVHAALGEVLLTNTAAAARVLESKRSGSFIASDDEIWLRAQPGFARIGFITPGSNDLHDVWLFASAGSDDLVNVTHANRAIRQDDSWLLIDVRTASYINNQWRFSTTANTNWPEGPSPELIKALSVAPQHLSFQQLLQVIDTLRSQQSTLLYELVLWARVTDSLTIFVLMFGGLMVVANRTRARPGLARGAGVVALVVMFTYYYAAVIIRQATLDDNWPAPVGAAAPPLLLALVLGSWQWHRRRAG